MEEVEHIEPKRTFSLSKSDEEILKRELLDDFQSILYELLCANDDKNISKEEIMMLIDGWNRIHLTDNLT
jgi:hypothetical protein